MSRTLQFDPDITNTLSPANTQALTWWNENRHRGLFPTDRQVLPDPKAKRTLKVVDR
jgi:hypothetical protein